MLGPTCNSQNMKREAVQLHRASSKSISRMTGELGVANESLRRRISQYEIDLD
jgi:transposase-like protein